MTNECDYIMGIDPYGYDGNVAVVIVMKRLENNDTKVVASYKGRPSIDFDKEVKRLVEYYKIPDSHILNQPQ